MKLHKFLVTALLAGAVSFGGPKAQAGNIIAVDGSSTVYPITEAVAEEFQKTNDSKVTVGISGTGGGFKKFVRAETDISDASRPIKQSELDLCKENGVEFIELPVAYDGLAVVVNKENTWVDHLTVAELKKLWEPAAQNKLKHWNEIREGWPKEEIRLFGPGVDSGTFEYFTEAVCGKAMASRGDYTASEDDNVLVQGVGNDKYALGYFGYAYYIENKDTLRVVPIDDGNDANGKGPITPSVETVANSTYQPLSRPIFIYVNKKSSTKKEVEAFVNFYFDHAKKLVAEVGYIPLPDADYTLVKNRFIARTTGSVFQGSGAKTGVTIQELFGGK